MPAVPWQRTPRANIIECREYGAQVTLIDGLITDCGAEIAKRKEKEGWFDLSTLKEPYRVEGKKTLGYELAEQLNWELPDVIIYPTGGGTGLIGMWKAFDEMQQLGWIGAKRPRFVSVQAAGCAPVVKAFETGKEKTETWPNPQTRAYGLRVPSPLGGFLCVRALRETNGTAIAIPENDMEAATRELAALSGLDICPEGGAAWAALSRLRSTGFIKAEDEVVVFNTGTGLKYR